MILDGLNPSQKRAVEAVHGRVLVLAGAGSGKTKVLTTRIVHLIQSHRVDPESIIGVTFTNKAAQEMRVRLSLLIGKKIAERVTLSTFHSFALQVLRKEIHHLGFSRNFSIGDRQDILRMVQSIVADELDHNSMMPSVQDLYEEISRAKNQAKLAEEITYPQSKFFEKLLQNTFNRLNQSMKVYNTLDFDHLLYAFWLLLRGCPDVLERYQKRYQYVLIDEYQDTNPIQSQIANMITKQSGNLCVVGDDDQSIYSWRGADVSNILQFPADTVVKLEQNFRSTNTILKAANSVIGKNNKRYKKALWSSGGDGDKIEIFCAPHEEAEAEGVIRRIVAAKKKHNLAWKDFCILYRSNILTKAVENALLRAPLITKGAVQQPIPYTMIGQDDLFDHKEMRDIGAYLRVACNRDDEAALIRVINYPRRNVGEQTIDRIRSYAQENNVSMWDALDHVGAHSEVSQKSREGVLEFQKTVEQFRGDLRSDGAASAVRNLLKRSRMYRALEHEIASDSLRKRAEDRLQGFLDVLSSYPHIDSHESLLDILSHMQIDASNPKFQSQESVQDVVTLMTIHSSKGLEYPYCFLIGLEDHLIPHERSIDEAQIEEERRLMYVAITRAKKNLCMSMAESRRRLGGVTPSRPSRFLFDIPQECLNATIWNG